MVVALFVNYISYLERLGMGRGKSKMLVSKQVEGHVHRLNDFSAYSGFKAVLTNSYTG